MIIIELEDIVVSILALLLMEKEENKVNCDLIIKCIGILNRALKFETYELRVLDYNDCMNKSKYFDVRKSDNNIECILKENVDIKKILSKLEKIPFQISVILQSKPILECLDIASKNITLSSELLTNSSHFYFKVADSLSVEEYKYIKESLLYKRCHNCMVLNCKIRQCNLVCDNWENKSYVGRSKVLNQLDIRQMK